MRRSLLTIALSLFFISCSNQQLTPTIDELQDKPNFHANVVYGEDDRKDWYEVLDSNVKEAARATLGIIDSSLVTLVDDKAVITTRNLRLCPNENFSDQKAGPDCSGFLVGADLVLTAGHCILSESHCTNLKFIFDYAKETPDADPTVISQDSVYTCKKLIGRELTNESQDWALVQLDRRVTDRRPLEIERSKGPSLDSPLTIIGHPSGLPSKISRGGMVHKIDKNHFVADLDSFGGNSGSAVFNANTLKVEGILVRGRTDYKFEGGCLKVNVCEEGIGTQCKFPGASIEGEHVSKTIILTDLIPPLPISEPEPDEPVEPVDPSRHISKEMLPIPDSYIKSVTSKITGVPAVSSDGVKVRLVVEHTYISDLKITLTAPNGKVVVLHGNTGPRVQNINGIYGGDLNSHESLSLLDEQPKGDWLLKIHDRTPLDKGYLIEWEILPL